MEEKIYIGARLRELRDKKDVSQKTLSELLGIKQPVIARYEMCAINPSYENLVKLADYFDVSTDYLLGRTDLPQGKLYGQSELAKNEHINEIIEMCFDPTTTANAKLRETLKRLLDEQ